MGNNGIGGNPANCLVFLSFFFPNVVLTCVQNKNRPCFNSPTWWKSSSLHLKPSQCAVQTCPPVFLWHPVLHDDKLVRWLKCDQSRWWRHKSPASEWASRPWYSHRETRKSAATMWPTCRIFTAVRSSSNNVQSTKSPRLWQDRLLLPTAIHQLITATLRLNTGGGAFEGNFWC